MTLDIIIPAYNEINNLQTLLPFLLANTNPDKAKIYVVDAERSSDQTQTICEQYGVHYIKSTHTQRSLQMNDGADASQCDYLFFLHADVIPPSNFFDLIEEAINKDYEAGCFAYKFNSNKLMLKMNSYFTRFKGIYTGGGDQGLFISRDRFTSISGYCKKHKIMEDFELYSRLKKNKIPYKIIREEATVSSRKYKNNSWLKVNLINLIALTCYKLNPDPDRIYAFYQRWIST